MAKEQFSAEELKKYPDIRGRLHPGASLTELERAVASFQDLLNDDGSVKEEALVPAPEGDDMSARLPNVVSLESLTPDAEKIEQEIHEIQGEHAPAAEVDDDTQIDAPLPPPGFDEDSTPGPPPGVPVDDAEENHEPLVPAVADLGALIAKSLEPFRCAHCGWDQRQTFKEPEYTEENKLAFIRP